MSSVIEAPVATARIVHGLPFADYLADPGVSRSQLLDLAESPATFHAKHRAPNRPPRKPPTPNMLAGSVAHAVLFEPSEVLKRYRVRPPGLDGRTREGKAWLADVPPDIEVITDEQMTVAHEQRNAVLAVGEIASLLGQGQPEVSVFWTDDRTGLRCKARPDWLFRLEDKRLIVLDLKTSRSITPAGFGREIATYWYDVQAAFYTAGIEAAGEEVAAFMFATVNTEAPFFAQGYTAPREMLGGAQQLLDALLRLLEMCERTASWPKFGDEVQDMLLPSWYPAQQQDHVTRVARLSEWIAHQPKEHRDGI